MVWAWEQSIPKECTAILHVFLVLLTVHAVPVVLHTARIVSVMLEFDIIPSVRLRSSFSSHWPVSVQGSVSKITSFVGNLDHSTK